MAYNKGDKMAPDWFLQVSIAVVAIFGGGALWHFMSQKQYHHALWCGTAIMIIFIVVIALYIRNGLLETEMQAKTPVRSAALDQSKKEGSKTLPQPPVAHKTDNSKVNERNFHLIQSAKEQIKDLEVDFRIRGNNMPGNDTLVDIQGPVCQLALRGLKDDDNQIFFKSSNNYQIARVGSGKGGLELRMKFRLDGKNNILGQEVAALGTNSRIGMDISELYKAIDLGLDAKEKCGISVTVKVNGVSTASIEKVVASCSIFGEGIFRFEDENKLPNVPFIFALLREKRFNGPLLYSSIISRVSEYSKALSTLGKFAANFKKTALMPSPVAVSIFDHTSGKRVDYSQTTLDNAVTIVQGYATDGTVPVSIAVGGTGAVHIGGSVSFTPGVKR